MLGSKVKAPTKAYNNNVDGKNVGNNAMEVRINKTVLKILKATRNKILYHNNKMLPQRTKYPPNSKKNVTKKDRLKNRKRKQRKLIQLFSMSILLETIETIGRFCWQ